MSREGVTDPARAHLPERTNSQQPRLWGTQAPSGQHLPKQQRTYLSGCLWPVEGILAEAGQHQDPRGQCLGRSGAECAGKFGLEAWRLSSQRGRGC